jgi:DNA-directed RNA polymerase alpha subunit
MNAKKTLRSCPEGHKYEKSSDCPSCPTCEAAKRPSSGFLAELSSPARSALEHEGITTLSRLSQYTEAQILALHGVGPKSLPTLRKALESQGKAFKKKT